MHGHVFINHLPRAIHLCDVGVYWNSIRVRSRDFSTSRLTTLRNCCERDMEHAT